MEKARSNIQEKINTTTNLIEKEELERRLKNLPNPVSYYKLLESHVDRHDIIGHGHIGLEGLKYIFKWATDAEIDIILETGGSFKEQKDLLFI